MKSHTNGNWILRILSCALFAGATEVRGANHQGGHADDRVHCTSDRPEVAIAACTHIIDDDRLDVFERATALKNRAFHYQEQGDLDRSIADYTVVLSRPEQRRVQAKTYLNRGLVAASCICSVAKRMPLSLISTPPLP